MEKEAINRRFMDAVNHLLTSKAAESKGELAETFGIKNTKFSEILNNRMNIGTDLAAIICVEYEINPDWLLTGRGSMLRSDADNKKSELPAVGCTSSSTPISPTDESFIYKMYKEEKAEKEALIEEVGGLKERLRQLESSQSTSQDKRQSDEIALAFPSDSSGGSIQDSIHTRKATAILGKSSAGKI